MIPISILIILSAGIVIRCNKWLRNNFIKLQVSYGASVNEYNALLRENEELIKRNNSLKNQLEKTIALYDITKEICKYLDEAKVFNTFKSLISKYIHVAECKFLKKGEDLSEYGDYIVIPLEINRQSVGSLAVSGIAENQMDEFNILAQQFVLGIKRAILYQRVQEMAITDGLTGVLGRRYWSERFTQELERSKKFKLTFSFLMIDIDFFKKFNDRYGHLVGDVMLREVAKRIQENIRQVDLICRYGGEEFCVILIETDKAGARFAAERIRCSIEEKQIKAYDEGLQVTVSIGISVFPEDAVEANVLLDKADSALYRAKQSGRNLVCAHGVNK